jgi:IMP dehydrogenase
MTGCGVPQISAIANIKKALCTRDLCNQNKYHIIADGGIKNSGDIVKALAVGANSVMIGKILASCDESPSSIIHSNGHNYKEYRGQSSYEFQKDNNIYRCDITPEGESFLIDSSGPVKSTLDLLVGGIKSGMSYLGVNNITELYEQSKFVKISQAGLNESKPHGKN